MSALGVGGHDERVVALSGLLPGLRRLDNVLARAVTMARATYGAPADDVFRGLHVGFEEVARSLTQPPGEPRLWNESPLDATAHDCERLDWLRKTFGADDFDADVVLLALAPELDLRYERVFAYLQDDVTRRRPSVDIVLDVLCPEADARLARRSHFAAQAPLVRHGLVHLVDDPSRPPHSLLGKQVVLDEQVVSLLLGQRALDRRIAPHCSLVPAAPSADDADAEPGDAARRAVALARRSADSGVPLTLYLHGPCEMEARRVAATVAGDAGAPLLVVHLSLALADSANVAELLRLAAHDALARGAVLYVDRADALREPEHAARLAHLHRVLAGPRGTVILSGAREWAPSSSEGPATVSVSLAPPGFVARDRLWRAALAGSGIRLAEPEVEALAARFRLSRSRIGAAVAAAVGAAAWRGGDGGPDAPTLADLFAAARAQSRTELAGLAQRIAPRRGWADLVIPDDGAAQLRELCARVACSHRVFDEWGFDGKLAQGCGVNALFTGPSGTGKTTAAEVIAGELGLDLYRIDLAGVVSKYIGETEKNLSRVFEAAADANAVLLFDEADALFGKRSEVRDSHDRYANVEISYLLQKIEQYEGVAILATNLRGHLDDAFVRRLSFTVHFPFPDDAARRVLWERIWPAGVPMAPDVDLDAMATRFQLSGGNIKNVALAAAFLAASNGGRVTMDHLLLATRREYQKLGKYLHDEALRGEEGGA